MEIFKPRLQRLTWLYTDHPLYFITSNTHRRRCVLAQEAVQRAFVAFAASASERGVLVGRYVLMPEHVHFFVAVGPGGPSLSCWVQSLKVALAKVLRGQKLPGPYWQKGFFDHVLRSSESYAKKWEYVRQNPVRAGLVARAEDWPFKGEVFPLDFVL